MKKILLLAGVLIFGLVGVVSATSYDEYGYDEYGYDEYGYDEYGYDDFGWEWFDEDHTATQGDFFHSGATYDGHGAPPVPEPSTFLLLGAGLIGLVGYNRKRLSKKA